MSETPDALVTSIKAERPVIAEIAFADDTFKIVRKPSTLLLAELARTSSGDPEAIAVIADFFEATMGKDEYRRFKRAVLSADADDEGDTETLLSLVGEVMEKTLGRPTA